MKYKIGDRIETEAFGPAIIKDIFKSITKEEDFVYLVSPLDDLENHWFIGEDEIHGLT